MNKSIPDYVQPNQFQQSFGIPSHTGFYCCTTSRNLGDDRSAVPKVIFDKLVKYPFIYCGLENVWK